MAEHQKFEHKNGLHFGSGGKLTQNILKNMGLKSIKDHPWYSRRGSLQAHHIIVSEAIKSDGKWKKYCSDFGYNINSAKNGVMLPGYMKLACQLGVPMHKSNHNATVAEIKEDFECLKKNGVSESNSSENGSSSRSKTTNKNYPRAVADLLEKIKDDIESGDLCGDGQMVAAMNKVSRKILKYIDSFSWTLTYDGKDYDNGGRGCGGEKINGSIAKKRDPKLNDCFCEFRKKGLDHQIRHKKTGHVLSYFNGSLTVGR